MALTSAEILPTKCLIKYRDANTQYKGITIERLTCYHTKLLCTGSPLTAAAPEEKGRRDLTFFVVAARKSEYLKPLP
jgi:hypothetical protein